MPPCSGCNQEIDIVEQYADPSRQHHLSAAAGNIHPFKGGRLPNGESLLFLRPTCGSFFLRLFPLVGKIWLLRGRVDDVASQARQGLC